MKITDKIELFDYEFNFTYARSSGSGGQNVNKVNSKAILKWNPIFSPQIPADLKSRILERFTSKMDGDGFLTIQSDRFRDQFQNVRDCKDKLKAMILSVLHPPKPRKKTKPTRSSKEKRLTSKRLQSEKKRSRREW